MILNDPFLRICVTFLDWQNLPDTMLYERRELSKCGFVRRIAQQNFGDFIKNVCSLRFCTQEVVWERPIWRRIIEKICPSLENQRQGLC